jgi:hypothetical protein
VLDAISEGPSLAPDFLTMVGCPSISFRHSLTHIRYEGESDSILQSHRVFAMTAATKGLDLTLQTVLISLIFDTEGKLVKSLS